MPHATALSPAIGGKEHIDVLIAELAARQHGVVAMWQLRELEIGSRAVEHRLARGRLHRLRRGVYAVGHRRVSHRGRLMAAVLAVGPGAVLSHRDAAALYGISRNGRSRIEVTVARQVRSRKGIQVHCAQLREDEITIVDGIPVTTVPRTLLDLAAVVDRSRLERAVHEVEHQRLWDPLSLADMLGRYPGRPGTPAIRAVLADLHLGLNITRSELEALFLALVKDEGLLRPETNASLDLGGATIEPDFIWREQRLIVELDGGALHRTGKLFESDRERDRRLQVAGWRVVRVTWRQLQESPRAVAADLRALLAL